jgi:hypothetical protein
MKTQVPLTLPEGLHPDTKSLVLRFAEALAKKLNNAEEKYGYSDGWMETAWVENGKCRGKLMEHIAKGDPRDVAAYCAFLWHHAASTSANQDDPPNAVFPPFKRGRTGIKGRTKYIQVETGSWITFNEDGSCHIGARHQYLGNLLELAGDYQQRKEYADAWRINMQRAERELAEAREQLKAVAKIADKWLTQFEETVEGLDPEEKAEVDADRAVINPIT